MSSEIYYCNYDGDIKGDETSCRDRCTGSKTFEGLVVKGTCQVYIIFESKFSSW